MQFKGVYTALITPFTADDKVDVPALKRLVQKQLEAGVTGIVACGTTAETPTLDSSERELVSKTIIGEVAGKAQVIVGTGSNSTKATITATQQAKEWGADAALVVAPYYNKPTQEGMYLHFRAVADQGGLPVVAYNVPGRTSSDLLPETIARLVEAKAIVAIKDATGDMARITETRELTQGHDFTMLSGDDFSIMPFVALGGHGVISVVSHLAPKDTIRLVELSAAGKVEEARELHTRIYRLSQALFAEPNPIPVKAAMALAGWCGPALRSPMVTGGQALVDAMKKAMNTYRGQALDTSVEGFWQ